jgi:hypothetical protein
MMTLISPISCNFSTVEWRSLSFLMAKWHKFWHKKAMKYLLGLLVICCGLSFSPLLLGSDGKIGGTIHCQQCPQAFPLNGELTIRARHPQGELVAVSVIKKPSFPQLFLLTGLQSIPKGKPLPEEMLFEVELKYDHHQLSVSPSKVAKRGDRKIEISL